MHLEVRTFDFVGVDASLFCELVALNSNLRACKIVMGKYVNDHAIVVNGDHRIRIYHRSDIEFVTDNQFGNECVSVRLGASYYYRTDNGRWLLHKG